MNRHYSKTKNYSRGRFIVALLLGLAFLPASAQVILLDVEETRESDRLGGTLDEGGIFVPILPDHDTTWDYTPIGNGLWVLGCLGGAYLLGKRRKHEED